MGSETLLSQAPNINGEINTLTSSSSSSNNKTVHNNQGNHNNMNSSMNKNTHMTPHIHSISPMSFMATSSVGSSSSATNQSKENLNGYHLKDYQVPIATATATSQSRSSLVDYACANVSEHERDEISTQSSHFTHQSGNNSVGSSGRLYRSKSRAIFSSSEKFQSHQDLKSYYEREEELERQQHHQQQVLSQSQHQQSISLDTSPQLQLPQPTKFFGRDIRTWSNHSPQEPIFDKHLRDFIDIHIAKARKKREDKYIAIMKKIGVDLHYLHNSISSNSYVPYPSLRHERRFLYDVDTYPLHQHLADILGVPDLSQIHNHTIQDKKVLMKPLLDAKKREAFHKCYDNFVSSFCIPLLHSLAMSDNLFNDSSSIRRDDSQNRISYRYQAFPCIRVNRPGEFSIGPHCDMAYGHSMGNINFHIPLTPTYGTNALYTESHPGREDWHPLKTKSIGLGYSFDGARNLHFTLENTTDHTRVSLDFRIAIHRETRKEIPSSLSPNNVKMMMDYSQMLKDALHEDERCNDVHDVLCNKKMLQDNYSSFPGYYEEANVELGTHSSSSSMSHGHGPGPVVCKRHKTLMHPDRRVGFPF